MPDPTLSAETVVAVARLARLEIDAAEVDDLRARLGAVLAHAQRLEELDLKDVKPLTHVGEETSRFAPAEPGPTLATDEALALAPDRYERFFRVPKVLGDGGGA